VSWLEPRPDTVRIRIHAQPGAKRSEVIGLHGDSLKVKIHAPPVEGKANSELLGFLAGTLECKRNQLAIVAGETSREKVIEVTGLSPEYIREKLR
jgi:uncharacterized protein (TIGR00251 family)